MKTNIPYKKTPVFLIGGYGLGNYGDDLLMVTHLSVIRRVFTDDEIIVTGGNPVECYCADMLPGPLYVPHETAMIIDANVAIYGGGTQFYSFPDKNEGSLSFSRVRRVLKGLISGRIPIKRLWNKQLPKVELGKSNYVVATSIGLGPFESINDQDIAKEKLGHCDLVCVRDNVAYEYTSSWGLDNVKLRSDFVFAHNLWLHPKKEIMPKTGSVKRVGLIPRDWRHTREGALHLESMLNLASRLAESGIEAVFYMFAPISDTESMRAVNNAGWPIEAWKPKNSTLDEYAEKLSLCDILVSARAHGAIVGSALGIPLICAVIEPKLKIMSELLGEGALEWEMPFDVDTCMKHISVISYEFTERSEAVLKACEKNKKLAIQATDELETFLRSTIDA